MLRPPLLVLVLLALACRGPRPIATETPHPPVGNGMSAGQGANTLGPGDLVEIRVFQEADLSGPFRVSPEGVLDFPLCGRVKVMGMTSSQAADALTQCLADKYLKRPQV